MYRPKHLKPTYYQASNTPSYRLVNCVMTIALQFSQNTILSSTTNTRNLSLKVSETMPRDYTNNVYLRPTIKPIHMPMQRCQQKTSKNTLNIFINVPFPQPLARGCKLFERPFQNLARSHHRGHKTLLTKIRSHNNGTLGPTTKKHTIHQRHAR